MIFGILFVCLLAIALIRARWSPDAAVALMVSLFGIKNFLQSQSTFFAVNGAYVNIAVGLVVVAAALRPLVLMAAQNRNYLAAIQPAIILYVYAFVSGTWTQSPANFLNHWPSSIPYAVLFLILGPICTHSVQCVSSALKQTLFIGVFLLFGMVFVADWGHRGMLRAVPVFDNGELNFETSILSTASYATMVGVLACFLPLQFAYHVWFRLGVFAMAVYVTLLTESRGQAMVLVLLPIIFSGSVSRGGLAIKACLAALATPAFVITFKYFGDLIGSKRWEQRALDSAYGGRFQMITDALSAWAGAGPFEHIFGFGAASGFVLSRGTSTYVHCLPIEVIVELGLIGCGIFLLFYFQVLKALSYAVDLKDAIPAFEWNLIRVTGILFIAFSFLSLKSGSLFGWHELFFWGSVVTTCVGNVLAEAWRHESGRCRMPHD